MKTCCLLALLTLAGCSAPTFEVASDLVVVADTGGSEAAPPETQVQASDADPEDDTADGGGPDVPATADGGGPSDTKPDSGPADAPADTSTCAECDGACTDPGEDHACALMCKGMGLHCSYSPKLCGCYK